MSSFTCDLCQFSNQNKAIVSEHMKKHISVRPVVKPSNCRASKFLCSFQCCSVRCTDQGNLMQHIFNKHMPEIRYDYLCPACDRIFKKGNSVVQHLIDFHDIEDCCPSCDNFYENENMDLEDHLFLECRQYNFDIVCTHCQFCAGTAVELEKHVKQKHPDIWYVCPFVSCSYKSEGFWSFSQHCFDEHLTDQSCEGYQCAYCDFNSDLMDAVKDHLQVDHNIEIPIM